MNVIIRKIIATGTYYVVLGSDVYEMSADAYQPNGLCMYLGDIKEMDFRCHKTENIVRAEQGVPFGIVRQIVHLLEHAAKREFSLAKVGATS